MFKSPTGILRNKSYSVLSVFQRKAHFSNSIKCIYIYMQWMELGWGTKQITLLEKLKVTP